MTTPYVPPVPGSSPMRSLYRSVAQVIRLVPSLTAGGSMSLAWSNVTDMVDPVWGVEGQLQLRLDFQFIRPGKDVQMPLVAGRAPDRTALAFFDCASDQNGVSLIKANDRLVMVSGPITGTWQLNLIPEVAQDFLGAHHIETQVIEVSQALAPGSVTPFPGSRP